ncbi:MAG: response regulator [Alphaproteobacteria bacterium]|nr:response regulator [Alphaproteobacteria bacterium]
MNRDSTVYIVEDDHSMRGALALLLEGEGYRTEQYGSAEEFLSAADEPRTGCALVDVRLPGKSGLDLLRTLTEKAAPVQVVMISGHGDIPMAVSAMRAGALHFIEKPFEPAALVGIVSEAVRLAESRPQNTDSIESLRTRFHTLTPREHEILRHVAQGLSSKQIAAELRISPRTVDNHRASIMDKMKATNLSILIRMTMLLGGDRP